jgi:hypothetical protein
VFVAAFIGGQRTGNTKQADQVVKEQAWAKSLECFYAY